MLKIRRMNEQNAERLHHLYSEIEPETDDLIFEPGEAGLNTLTNVLKDSDQCRSAFFIAEQDNTDIGFAAIIGHSAIKMNRLAHVIIAVRKEWREHGYGRKLLVEAEKWATDNHFFRLEASIADDNRAALLLFGTSDYHVEGIRQSALFIDDLPKNAFYMAKLIKENLSDRARMKG